jgi:transposase
VVVQAAPVTSSTVVVAVDVGKTEFAFSVTDLTRALLLKPRTGCPMTGPSLRQVINEISAVLPVGSLVKVGIEAAGHYHWPLLGAGCWPAGWELLELNPGHVTEQRKVLGKRTIKTDVIDVQAMTELLLAGRGLPVRDRSLVLTELTAWSAHRSGRVALRTATKNQLLGQLDRTFPGLTLALPDVLGTKVGRLVAAEFADPARLAALGAGRFIRFRRHPRPADPQTPGRKADPGRQGCPAHRGRRRRQGGSDRRPDLARRPGPSGRTRPRQIYRTAGLNPIQYESAGKRRDTVISREGSVELRRALIDLGIGLWLTDPAAKLYGRQLRARGKNGGVIACAMAHRASRIAYALVRDQAPYDPSRWTREV